MMTSLIGILILVSALTATSSALSCTQCNSTSWTCSGDNITCPTGSMCGSVYSRSHLHLKIFRTGGVIRGCVPSSFCNFNGSMSVAEGQIDEIIPCCDTDGCTPPRPPFSRKSTKPNGVICRSCYSIQSDWCYNSVYTVKVNCTGDENMCLRQKTEISGSVSTSLRGCATKSYCDHPSLSYTTGESSMKLTHYCTSGGMRAHKVFLTPAIVCLLLLKLFL